MNYLPHIILETANFHGGNVEEIKKTIENFSELKSDDIGIKFHAFKPENVCLEDFSWYPVVKNFFIDEKEWEEIIDLSVTRGLDVWLDLFCVYGVHILAENIEKIRGIKLQPSILDNRDIMKALEEIDVTDLELIINISGLEITEIEKYLKRFDDFHFKSIILQLGFQNHPTNISDTSLSKIDMIFVAFPELELSYADHNEADKRFAVDFPAYAFLKGCGYIEKHICNDRKNTEYDATAALEFSEMEQLLENLANVSQCLQTPFITENEKKYFDKSIQKPVLKHPLNNGQLAAGKDMSFRRTDKPGMNLRELKNLQGNLFILNKDKETNDTLTHNDFKKPKIAAIVACRMKSSRLKQKAILPIAGMPSIERCLDNCFMMPHVDEVVLATSTTTEDAELGKYLLNNRAKFWQGDPEDVISRYLGACDKYGIDVIVRVTGDCPAISPEITEILLKSHFETGADFTEAKEFAVGASSQIYNVEALRRVIRLVGKADYSEHMTLYMTNNPSIFKVNYVNLPQSLIRDYRLTLDYQEDLDMFDTLYKKLAEQNLPATTENIFKILDANPNIPKLNEHHTLVYRTDHDLIKLLNEKTTIKI